MADSSQAGYSGDILSLLGSLGSLGSNLSVAGAQNNSASLAQQYAQATSQLPGFSFGTGSGGLSASYGAGGQGLNYGSLQNPYNQLTGLAGSQFGTAGGISAPSGLNAGLSNAFGQAAGGLSGFNTGAASNAANSAFLGAGNAATAAGGGYANQVNQQYQALQGLHAQSDTNAFNNLQSSLFGNGTLGASSGALQTTAFAKGLGQENSQDAANAQQLGLQAQQSDTNTATGLGSLGSGLLNSAFSNFGQTAQLGPNIAGGYLNNGLNSVQGAGNITQQGLGVYNAGLQTSLAQNQASARAGSLSTTNANSPNQQSPYGQLLSGLFGGLATGGSGGSSGGSINNLINGGKNLYNLLGGSSIGSTADSMATSALGDYSSNFALGGVDTSSDLSSLFGSYFNAASGEAAAGVGAGALAGEPALASIGTGAVGAATDAAAADAAASLGGGAAAGAGAAGGLAISAGTGIGLLALPYMLSQLFPGKLNANYYKTMTDNLNAGPGTGQYQTGNQYSLDNVAQNTQYQGARSELLQSLAKGTQTPYTPQQLAGFGITAQDVSDYSNMGNLGAMGNALADSMGIPRTSSTSNQKK